MDPPYENGRSTTALRRIDAAIRRGSHVNVFAYEGAVGLPFALQQPHPNGVHGRNVEEEDYPLPRDWVAALMAAAAARGVGFGWVNCGLCVDERGVGESIAGLRRGTPGDLWSMAAASDNTLVVPTRS